MDLSPIPPHPPKTQDPTTHGGVRTATTASSFVSSSGWRSSSASEASETILEYSSSAPYLWPAAAHLQSASGLAGRPNVQTIQLHVHSVPFPEK